MSPDRSPALTDAPACSQQDCGVAADFWRYHPDGGDWRPICHHHLVTVHPSIEVAAWIESGYARPIELAQPDGPLSDPRTGRAAAFRDLVDETMGWDE